MPRMTITGMDVLDGEYEADITTFTNRELHIIKQESGVVAGKIPDALEQGDNDVIVAIAMVCLVRAGRGTTAEIRDILWEAEAGGIEFRLTPEERAEQEAQKQKRVPPQNGVASTGNEIEATPPSGTTSTDDSASKANDPKPIGIHG